MENDLKSSKRTILLPAKKDTIQFCTNIVAAVLLASMCAAPFNFTLGTASTAHQDVAQLSVARISLHTLTVYPPRVIDSHRAWAVIFYVCLVLYVATPCFPEESVTVLHKVRAVTQCGVVLGLVTVPYTIQKFSDHGITATCTTAWYIALVLALLMIDVWSWRPLKVPDRHGEIQPPPPQRKSTSGGSTSDLPVSTSHRHLESGHTAVRSSKKGQRQPLPLQSPRGYL